MQDFSAAVNTAMQTMIDNGKIEEIIKAKLEKTVESAIDDALRSYSDFGKQLSKHVQDSLKVDVSNVNLQEYGKTVLGLVEGLVNKHIERAAQGKLLEQLNELFEPPPAKITLQELVDAYKGEEEDEAHRDGHEYCGLVIEKSDYDYLYVGFNPCRNKAKYGSYTSSSERIAKVNDCEIQLHMKKPEKSSELYELKWISFGGHRDETTKQFLPTMLHGMARRLYQMYCSGTLVDIDSLNEDDYELAYNWVD